MWHTPVPLGAGPDRVGPRRRQPGSHTPPVAMGIRTELPHSVQEPS